MTTTVSQRQAAFRARRHAEGLEEVRGIWAPKACHKQIKVAAKSTARIFRVLEPFVVTDEMIAELDKRSEP